ncbi:CCA tRNA nucleotidyltransferase [Alkalihalophilus marmarensis]|uniref:CCA tRNA nucleotidyltransferase n=1 Tax=Alkalihalophilus marmarensis TaxID=521377 RepID=UPI002E236FE0|nr:CCA tRNA nucleotidyltransferase [Alkalihalophilus marmarensis]
MKTVEVERHNQKMIDGAEPVLSQLHERGFLAYIVGGAVRDLLCKRPITDIDIVTEATPEEISTVFSKTFSMNNQHQTVIVRHSGCLFEVTTQRGKSIEEDLLMRDFTINSIALDKKGQLFDPLDGQSDIKNQVIRSHNPTARMSEDPLRMLRAYRFSSDLGFKVAENLGELIRYQAETLSRVAMERISKEFYKLVSGPFKHTALKELASSGLYKHCGLPQLDKKAISFLRELPVLMNEKEEVVWTFICLSMGLTSEGHLKGFLFSNQLTKDVRNRLAAFSYRNNHSWEALSLYRASIEVALDVERVRELTNESYIAKEEILTIWEQLPIKSKNDLAVTGTDLLRHFKREAGPWLGEALLWVEEQVATGDLPNEKDTLLQAIVTSNTGEG